MTRLHQAVLSCAAMLLGCAPRPMFVGPPTSMPAEGVKFSAGAGWTKPVDSANIGMPALDGAMHLPVSDVFDLAIRAWALGGGMQGRVALSQRSKGSAVDIMLAPLLGVSTVVGLKEEDDERLLPPIETEFLVTAPLALGFGLGGCSAFVGGEPILHLRPDEFVLRAAGFLGFACPTQNGMQIAPEVVFEAPLVGGDQIRPEEGYAKGAQRHPWLASVIRFGVAFSF